MGLQRPKNWHFEEIYLLIAVTCLGPTPMVAMVKDQGGHFPFGKCPLDQGLIDPVFNFFDHVTHAVLR